MTTYKVAVSSYKLDRKIPPGSEFWSRFNASFINLEETPERLMQYIYEGKSFTTWHKDQWRVGTNYICGQHLGLDFDHGGDMYAMSADKFVSKYAAFMYTTPSHTEENPRFRVVFLLDTPIYQPKNYTLAAQSLLWLYGGADPKCKDAVRFFYGSQFCEFQMLGNVLPLEVVKKLIANYQESGRQERKQAERSEYNAPATHKDVADALGMIDPWGIDYDEWVSILMAIHAQFGDGGFAMADAWAKGADGEVARKWKSFNQTGNVQGMVTIATVFGIAKRFGWKNANLS